MVEELEQETQQDPIPKLPKGYVAIKKSGLPPLPAGYVEKKNLSVNGVGVGGQAGSSKAPSNVPTYTPNTDKANPFSIGGQYNQPKKLDAEGLDMLNTKHDAAIAEQIKKYPLRKIPLTPILDNTYRAKPISEIDINEALSRNEQHKIDMQTAIDNTTLKVLKQKGIVAGKNDPLYIEQRKKIEEKTKPTMIGGIVVNGAEATYHKDKDGNIGLDRNLGFLEDMRKGFNAAVDGEDEAKAFNRMTTEQKVQYANQKMQENPNPEYMSERSGVGGLVGGSLPYLTRAALAGTAATAAAIAAPETGGASLVGLAPALTVLLTAHDMIEQGSKDEQMARFYQLKQENPDADENELMRIAEKGGISGGLLGAANALAYTTSLKLPIAKESKNVLTTYLKGVTSSAIHLGGITGASKAAQLAERKLEGYNVDTDKAIDEIKTTVIDNGTAGGILAGFIHGKDILPNVIKSAYKWVVAKQIPSAEIKTVLDANVQAGRITPEVAEQTIADIDGYKTALAKTSDGLTPETQASVAGLIQARDNVAAEMATKDPTQRAVYEQKIEAYNKQIEKITKTNDPLKYEIDEVTGNPIDKVASELPDLTVPIEGTDKKGIPIGEDVPAETKPSTPTVQEGKTTDVSKNSGLTAIEPEEIQRQMKPITDRMAEIEREFENKGYEIDWDYDNEIQVTDKKGNQLEADEIPQELHKIAAEYEKATSKLGEFSQSDFVKSLEKSRKRSSGEEVPFEEVGKKQLPQQSGKDGEYFHGTNNAEKINKEGFSSTGEGSSFVGDNYVKGVYLSKSKEPYQEGGQMEDVTDVLTVSVGDLNIKKVDGFKGLMDLRKEAGIGETEEGASEKLTKYLQDKGFDGLDIGEETVVFNPKNVKVKSGKDVVVDEGVVDNTTPKGNTSNVGGEEGSGGVVDVELNNKKLDDWHSELKKDKNVFWHGSPSGDMRGSASGLHIGTHLAAKQALEARIGVKADGTDWNGTEEYGKTLLAGKKTLSKEENKWKDTGYNSGKDVPEEDYYPSQRKEKATYSDQTEVSEKAKPNMQPVRIKGEMSNSTNSPHEDFKANGYMKAAIKKGNAKRGYYYENVGEDSGSISAVVPNKSHIEVIENPLKKQSLKETTKAKTEPIKNEEPKVEVQQPSKVEGITEEKPIEVIPEEGEGGKEPPKEPAEPVGEEGGKKEGITHAAVEELRKIIGESEYEGKPVENHETLIEEAQRKIKENPNAANEVLDKMENGGKITNKDNAVIAIYKATIDAEMAKNPTPELLKRATRLAKAFYMKHITSQKKKLMS